MSRFTWQHAFLAAIAACGGFLAIIVSHAAASAEEGKPPANAAVEIPSDLIDRDFDGMVDLAQLQRSLRSLDRPKLIVQAEALAEAERRVGHPHRGISADAVFRVLLRAIADARDAAALESTAMTLQRLQKEDLLPAVEQTRKLMSAPRKLDLGPDVPVSEVSAEGIVLYNTLKEQIRVARVIGDAEVLRELKQQSGLLEELHPKQRGYLSRLADDSLAALPVRPSGEQLAMSRLAGFAVRGKPAPKK